MLQLPVQDPAKAAKPSRLPAEESSSKDSSGKASVKPSAKDVAKPRAKASPTPRTEIAPNWRPGVQDLDWVRERFVASNTQIANQVEAFRDYHRGKGNKMADWSAAWRTWWNNGYHKIPRRLEAPAPLLEGKVRSESAAQLDAELALLNGGRV